MCVKYKGTKYAVEEQKQHVLEKRKQRTWQYSKSRGLGDTANDLDRQVIRVNQRQRSYKEDQPGSTSMNEMLK